MVIYSVPTGVPGTPNQGVSEEVHYGLGMPGGGQQRGSGKCNQGVEGGVEEGSLQSEDMEVEQAGVSTEKGKGVERGGDETPRVSSPSMHAPKESGGEWRKVGRGGR